jgi:hypothetical protein
MRLDASGNLGIGTSSPGEKLTVLGGGATSSTVNFTGGAAGNDNATIASDYSLSFQVDANNSIGSREFAWRVGGKGYSDGTLLMTLNASGNLGLGVTPSAWAGSVTSLDISGGGSLFGGSFIESVGVWLAANAFYNSSGNGTYKANGFAPMYNASGNTGAHRWYTSPSGTAGGVVSFTQAMTLDASGNLGVGETSPTSRLHLAFTSNSVDATLRVQQKGNNTAAGITLSANDNNGAGYNFIQSETTGGTAHWKISGGVATSTMAFSTGGSERARIDSSGNLLVGTTTSEGQLSVAGSSSFGSASSNSAYGIVVCAATNSSGNAVLFRHEKSSSAVGSITTTASTTSYNITSDRRLKENIQDAAPASALIDALQVREYDWKSDGTHQRYGFVAQELVTVAPEAVHQPADPEEMMAVDYSKLVPMLVKEIQDLRKRLAAANI